MYKIIGRERIRGNRLGKYVVEYSTRWVEKARNIYLVSEFTSWFPGHIKLRKIGNRGIAIVKLWEGKYHYLFSINGYEFIIDEENPNKVEGYKPYPEIPQEFTVSVSEVGLHEIKNALAEGGVHWEHVVHNEYEPMFISHYLDYYVIRIRTLRGEFTNIDIEYLCDGLKGRVEAYKVVSTDYHDYYEAIIKCNMLQAYRFILYDGGTNKYLYGDEGYAEEPSYITVKNIERIIEPPWYLGTIYYLIFIDSFYNGDPSNDPPEKIKQVVPRARGYLGGDIKGVVDKISYIDDLGVEAVYLTPIFLSSSYHRYDTIDYYSIDKYLGTLDDFKNLVKELHFRGIRLVLDIPVHHSSPCFKAFREALRHGVGSRYWQWYNFLVDSIDEVSPELLEKIKNLIEDPNCPCWKYTNDPLVKKIKPFYETFLRVWCMPKFNHDNVEVSVFIANVMSFWANLGVDGFRLDVSLGIPETSASIIYRSIKEKYPDRVIIGEVIGDPLPYMWENTYDSVMNYELRRLIIDFFVHDKIDAQEFARKTLEQYVKLPIHQANSLYNLLGSHDTPRIKTLAKGDKRKVIQAYAYLLVTYGAPSIYYGDEVGLEGGSDPDNRRPMIWDEDKWDKDIRETLRNLIRLRKSNDALRYGFYYAKALSKRVLLIKRWIRAEEVYAIFNADDKEAIIENHNVSGTFQSHNGVLVELSAKREIILGPREFKVFIKIRDY